MSIYIGQPYTHEREDIKEARYRAGLKVAAELFKAGYVYYSPIAQSHPVQDYLEAQQTLWEDWRIQDLHYLQNASTLLVVKLPGWDKSVGLTAEIAYAEENNIDIIYYDYDVNNLYGVIDCIGEYYNVKV